MNLARFRHALAAYCLLLSVVISACDGTNPSPTPLRSSLPSRTATSALAAPTNAPDPSGTHIVEASPTGPSRSSAFQPGPCAFHEWLVNETSCGTLVVPEDHKQPGGRQIKLAVAILKS